MVTHCHILNSNLKFKFVFKLFTFIENQIKCIQENEILNIIEGEASAKVK